MSVPRGLAIAVALLGGATRPISAQDVLHRNERFEVRRDAVRQGEFEARALGRDTIVSSYPRAAREVHFKFGLNGADNEFAPGTEQLINLRPRDGRIVTPAYVFGRAPEAAIPRPVREAGEEGEARVTIRLDLRHVLGAIRDSGGYTPPQGARLTRLERVTVIGDTEPLTWDIRAVPRGAAQDLLDPDGDGIYETTLAFRTDYSRSRLADGRAIWARRAALDAFPALESPEPLLDATYRLSLEELTQLVRTDGALSAGAKWPGVWTRDVSFASLLALAIVAPDAVRTSLLAKVDSTGRIIQDTGTGGSWPISSDRLTWALAAWELYAVTGDRDWLTRSYAILARSVAADRHAVIDPATGLANGESSFLDWREQSYPRWMQPADIYQSQAIGTNAVHHGAYRILARMARALGDTVAAPLAIGGTRELRATAWDAMADSLRRAIDTHLWLPGTGWYGQFRYGRLSPSVSPRAEALGLALTVLQGVADSARGAALVAAAPQVDFGTPTFWPFIPDERFYHNGSIWPFVTAFATWAAADVRNTAVVEHGLASLLRGTALFLTNKENMVAGTGHFEGTALNSDRQLWSVAGLLAMQYRVLFGLRFGADSLHFAPMVPPTYAGERTLRGVRWRGATLDITVRGTGSALSRMRLDGADVAGGALPATLAGRHVVVLELDGRWPASRMRHVEPRYAPADIVVLAMRAPARIERLDVAWDAPAPDVATVRVLRDGARVAVAPAPARGATVPWPDGSREIQLAAADSAGHESFASQPRIAGDGGRPWRSLPLGLDDASRRCLLAESCAMSGNAAPGVRTEQGGPPIRFRVRIARTGRYQLRVRYANGNGPVNTDDKAAIRTLRVDGRDGGVIVMPQRGAGAWGDLGASSAVDLALRAGLHELALVWTPHDRNMHGTVNSAIVAAIEWQALPPRPPEARR